MMKCIFLKNFNLSFLFVCLLLMGWACTSETKKEEIKDEKVVYPEEKKEVVENKIEETPIQDSASLTDKEFVNKTLEEEKKVEKKNKLDKKTEEKKAETKKDIREENTAKVKTKKKYDKIFAFHHGRAAVLLNGKYGYIDKDGYEVVAPKYDFAEDFTGLYNLARVRILDKVGFVSLEGKEVIPLKYRYVEKFYNGLAHARLIDGEQFYIDRNGNHVCDILDTYHEGLARIRLGKKVGYIDMEGNVIIPAIYEYGTHFSQGMADVKLNDKHFFINKKNECVKDCPQ